MSTRILMLLTIMGVILLTGCSASDLADPRYIEPATGCLFIYSPNGGVVQAMDKDGKMYCPGVIK